MPCPHFDVKIIQRSKRQSAVASAAYQSGERLFSEYDQKQKYYSHKSEIVHTEIMLPPHAPPEYADRNTLWNAAEAIEKQWNSQLARRFVLAIPRELPRSQYADLIRDYCREFFVSKGMIADFAIHDKGDGNPHAHILLTMRAMDETGKWLPKSRKVYDLDENGERIRLASGRWKSHKEDTNEVYLGKIIWNKKRVARTGSNKLVSNDKEEWIVVENAHEPIISDELFRKANEKAFTNQKKVLAKRGVACPIFFCPTCGRRLGFTSRETGYRCMQAHISGLSGCAESKMDRKEAEETVLDAAKNMAQFISENLEKKKSEWHKTILKEENIATLESEKKRLSSRKMKLYSDYRSEVLDKEGYMEELEKTTSRISEITLQIIELENEIATAKKKCDEATEKEMEVNEIAALQDFDKIQLSKIIEKVFIYGPGRMEINWKMDDIFYKEEKA